MSRTISLRQAANDIVKFMMKLAQKRRFSNWTELHFSSINFWKVLRTFQKFRHKCVIYNGYGQRQWFSQTDKPVRCHPELVEGLGYDLKIRSNTYHSCVHLPT